VPVVAGVGPVRIGNAAYVQTQHDVMGGMTLIARLVTDAIAASTEEDTGLWNAAITIGELLEARHGHFRAWTPWH
jgi:hypothetical protein